MKIECRCGNLIPDGTDDLPHKAHLIPDQDWLSLFAAIDAEVLVPLEARRIGEEAASMRLRTLLTRTARPAYQCPACGRCYIDDPAGVTRCVAPEDPHAPTDLFRRTTPRQARHGAKKPGGTP